MEEMKSEILLKFLVSFELLDFLLRGFPPTHPDPGPIVNVQVWDLAASAFWRFFGLFFATVHSSDAAKNLRRFRFQKWPRKTLRDFSNDSA